MGAEESSMAQQLEQNFMNNYSLYRTEYDHRFGEIQIYKH